jgi:hypothetical protein
MPKKTQAPAGAAGITIAALAELQRICAEDIPCVFQIDGKTITLPVQRMNAHAEEVVRAIRREAQPKWNPQMKEYDHTEPGYLQRRDEAQMEARSYLVYTGCKLVAAGKPQLTNRKEIHVYVSGLLPATVLDVLASTIEIGGVSLIERANFTSTAGSGN